MEKKVRIAILCGGPSAEHQVSLISAKNIIAGLDEKRYDISIIGIDQQGSWYYYASDQFLLHADDPKQVSLAPKGKVVMLIPGKPIIRIQSNSKTHIDKPLDVIFPVLHGSWGEDGSVQGLLHTLNVPFVGTEVLGSAICMDKVIAKRLLQVSGLPVVPFIAAYTRDITTQLLNEVTAQLGFPCFVKAATQGSSIGVYKVKSADELSTAVEGASRHSDKILFESFIAGRELECSVLGNHDVRASLPGEIVVKHEFYSYEAKYLDPKGAELIVPAKVTKKIINSIQQLAIEAFQTLQGCGLARVDFFLNKDGELYINELNTMPGFTSISMYPKLWEASGISYSELLDELIELAVSRFKDKNTYLPA